MGLKKTKNNIINKLSGIPFLWRKRFVKTLPTNISILEIGPFYSPICIGNKVKYFDILNKESLIKRARRIDEKISIEKIPYIDYVSPTGDLSIINETFDAIVSSHAVEHQLDLIDHLQTISKPIQCMRKSISCSITVTFFDRVIYINC